MVNRILEGVRGLYEGRQLCIKKRGIVLQELKLKTRTDLNKVVVVDRLYDSIDCNGLNAFQSMKNLTNYVEVVVHHVYQSTIQFWMKLNGFFSLNECVQNIAFDNNNLLKWNWKRNKNIFAFWVEQILSEFRTHRETGSMYRNQLMELFKFSNSNYLRHTQYPIYKQFMLSIFKA